MLGLSDEDIEKKKKELMDNIKTGKIDTNEYNHLSDNELPELNKKGKDSDKEMDI